MPLRGHYQSGHPCPYVHWMSAAYSMIKELPRPGHCRQNMSLYRPVRLRVSSLDLLDGRAFKAMDVLCLSLPNP